MDVRHILILFLLVSCLPAAKVSKGNLSSDGTTTPTDPSIPTSATNWNYLGNLTSSIIINASNLNNAYIAGSNAENFLATSTNFSQDYCMVSRYVVSSLTYELRTRVVPISYYDFTARRTVRIFRVDFNDVTNSQSSCGTQPLMVINSSGVLVPDPSVITAKTANPGAICSTCTSNLNSTKIFIFKNNGTNLQELSLAQVDIRSLSLAVDPNSTVVSNPGTCSQAACAASGYDCCLDNQCITDGAVRASASTLYSSQLQSAEEERLVNPLAYLNYPHLYYICGTTVPPATTTGGTSGGGPSYVQGLTQLQKDYFCVEKMKTHKTGTTFHQDLLTGLDFFPDDPDITDVVGNASTLYPADIECRNSVDPTSNMHYLKVAERLYQNCGCAQTTLTNMVTYCPAYEYSINYLVGGLPNRIDCFTPNANSTTPTIPTQQTVSVNSRSAPHRFFRTCGLEFGASGTCIGGDSQEGDFFEYLDSENVIPSQEPFGMNSILGQMKVTLDKALPAKAVSVELDQMYQLSTTSGFFTACPTCGKDSWFNSFSAFPSSTYGSGLQAVGHSTSRDAFDFNTTGGNYEDTIFGRACWLPPTMLPFSHSASASAQSQRLLRLKTQAALYANGYQKDWYGFNKGALIGSFDGVTWFAIGKGRIVRSTSKKLFLAINAPFADLASPSLHVVNVQAYDGITQAAQLDYDPALTLSHPLQNEAGNCQANHMCATDSDCVTRLGWEYMCADVMNVKTKWPQFDADANEVANTSNTFTIDQILQQKNFPSSSTKRCVYRGAGSLCIPNTLTVADLNKRKTLTCAPNFYCANINSSASVFNSKVSRYGSLLENIPVSRNHYFGKDANVLGRPLSYTASSLTTSLPTDVRDNLTQNMLTYESSALSLTGICLPGKALPELANQTIMKSPYSQHQAPDALGRTDYISQVGGCNSGLFTDNRYASCPVINADGNYDFLSTTYNLTTHSAQARNQNSCGLDSLLSTADLTLSADALSSSSPFRAFESKTLSTQTVITPSITRDACLRRAGSVCHTDLDCGPNKMHAEQTANFSLAYFGNEAERKYYNEYLVCGQADAKPTPGASSAYQTFNMNKNMCCREVGSDLSTYTSYTPKKLSPNQVNNTNLSSADDDYETASFKLQTNVAPGINPKQQYRYTRLATVENLGTAERPLLSGFQDRAGASLALSSEGSNVMTLKQWKTLGETNSESCCGGGWVRKFSDGTTDWSRRDRLYFDVKNFACLNSRSPLLTHPEDVGNQYGYPVAGVSGALDAQTLVNQDMGDYCKDAGAIESSCAQNSFPQSYSDTPPSSIGWFGSMWLSDGIAFATDKDFYFSPRSADGDPDTMINNSDTDPLARRNIQIRIPSYITRASFDIPDIAIGANQLSAQVFLKWAESPYTEFNCNKVAAVAFLPSPTTRGTGYCGIGACCYHFEPSTRTLKVVANEAVGLFNVASGKKVVVRLANVRPAGVNNNGTYLRNRNKPESDYYYLKRLGQMELSGIPQVNYQALTCNDNRERLVPGLFNLPNTDNSILLFNQQANSFYASYSDPTTGAVSGQFANHFLLNQEQVFSENDFKCCTPLGKKANAQSKCCSNYGVLANGAYTCGLPAGANLMVYFNRFVTNEGRGTNQPGGGLTDADFNASTGEPLYSAVVTAKINALGVAYCSSGKVRQGGAFGQFKLEPYGNDTNQNETIFNIVDSSNDLGSVSTADGNVQVGYNAFMNGFRWNHHLYCKD